MRVNAQGDYYWAVKPGPAWEDMKGPLATFVMATSEELANTPANAGRSSNLWSHLFSNMCVYAMQDEGKGGAGGAAE